MSRCFGRADLNLGTVLLVAILLSGSAFGGTYYIDYGNGNDGNNGTSETRPWKRQPFMNGFAGKYNHSPGDRFIFKGGVVWDSTNWRMTINAGGSSPTYDYYGVDQTWFTGGSWSRPIFDGGSTPLPPNGHMVQFEAGWVKFDNIEMWNLTSATGGEFLAVDAQSNIFATNMYIHGWNQTTYPISSISRNSSGVVSVVTSTPTNFNGTGTVNTCPQNCLVVYGVTGDTSVNTYCGNKCSQSSPSVGLFPITSFIDASHFSFATTNHTASGATSGGTVMNSDGYIIVAGEGGSGQSNIVLDHCTISNTEYSTTQNYGEVSYGWTDIQYCTIHDVGSVASGVRNVINSTFYDISYPTSTYDGGQHTDGAYQIYSGTIANNVVYAFAANESFFYINPEADNSTCTPNTVYMYNNVQYDGGAAPIGNIVDINEYYGSSPCDTVYIDNNTLEGNGVVNSFRIVPRGTGGLTALFYRNNHVINSDD